MEEIFGALLDISRLDTGVLRPDLTSFHIDDLMRQIAVEFTPLAVSKRLKLTFMPCAAVVRSDRRLLRRLIQNLVSNAIKYTPQGRVLVGCRRRGDTLRIDVYDTGLGIPAGKQRDIFVEFHRLDQGARIARGLGLGLSIVERVARVLGATVELDSTPGRGSHFAVSVPLSRAAPVALPARQNAPADPGQLAGTTALCIDNEPAVLDGMETLLRGWGCDVITAPNLSAALATVAAGPASPERAPGRLPPRPRQRHRRDRGAAKVCGNLPAILITADRSPAVREQARAQNIEVLHKPVKPAALRALLAQWRVLRVAAAE